mgnify:CR=1 FL=1
MAEITINFYHCVIFISITLLVVYICLRYIKKLYSTNAELRLKIDNHANELRELEKATRKDSTSRQRAILKGQISETLAPWSIKAVNSVKELSFLGNPIDFVGFKGLDGDGEIEIKFIEIKTGNSKLTKSEKRIKEAVLAKRIGWSTIQVIDVPEVVEK